MTTPHSGLWIHFSPLTVAGAAPDWPWMYGFTGFPFNPGCVHRGTCKPDPTR